MTKQEAVIVTLAAEWEYQLLLVEISITQQKEGEIAPESNKVPAKYPLANKDGRGERCDAPNKR